MARNKGNKPGRGKTDAEAAKDMMFGEAMERDMERYSHDAENPRRIDEDWKNHLRYDGNRNLEAHGDAEFGPEGLRHDAAFINRMYMPYLGSGASPLHSNIDPGKNSEFSTDLEFGPAEVIRNKSNGNNSGKSKDKEQ